MLLTSVVVFTYYTIWTLFTVSISSCFCKAKVGPLTPLRRSLSPSFLPTPRYIAYSLLASGLSGYLHY